MEAPEAAPSDGRTLKILQVMLTMGATSAPYNEHCHGFRDPRTITICTFFRPTVEPTGDVTLFAGDTTVPGFFRALRAALSHDRYDVVHVHSPHVGFLLLVARAVGMARGLPPTVHTVHSSYSNFQLRNRTMLALSFLSTTQVVCCSRASEASFPRGFRRFARRGLAAVPNGVDLRRVDAQAASAVRQAPRGAAFSVTAIGRLVDVEVKNPFAILGAFHLLDDTTSRLTYMGDGPLRDQLARRAEELGVAGRASFTGLIPREDVFRRLLEADVFVSSSRVEGLPVAVLEAMACGCPVVLSDIPPHREIADGVDFVPLVDPDDIEGLARELRRLRALPAAARVEIGERCRRLVEERFSLDRMHADYRRIYESLSPQPARPLGGA